MLRGVNIFCAEPGRQFQAIRRVLVLFLLPLGLLTATTLWKQQTSLELYPPASVALWIEPLPPAKSHDTVLADMLKNASWQDVQTPYTAQPWLSTTGAEHYWAWMRITLPPPLKDRNARDGRVGVMIKRVIGSGPWTAWAEGQLLQTNQKDWGIQWNTPLRVLLPVGANELYLSMPVRADQGFALGTLYTGSADDIELAWHERELWMTGLPRVAAIIAILLAAMTLPVALRHRSEPMYTLFCANALVWCLTNLQYFHDYTGNPGLSSWFGLAMDLSINWNVVLTLLFAFEFLPQQRHPRLAGGLIAYAVLSSVIATISLLLGNYDLFTNHYGNIVVFLVGLHVYLRDWSKGPTRESTVLLLTLLALVGTGVHSLLFVSSMAEPDHVHTFPMAVLASFFAYLYALSRRWAGAIRTAQAHQEELQYQLTQQKKQLQQQHEKIAAMELAQQLHALRQTLLQDLHDGLGSNLTSALVQARTGALNGEDTVLLLQELAQELRQLSAAPSQIGDSVGDILAQLRQRIDKRLARSAIHLQWDVSPKLPALHQLAPEAGIHLRAILNEAVANAIKHANASELHVHASVQDNLLNITVRDNGIGHIRTKKLNKTSGQGLHGMKTRASSMGWTIQAQPAATTDTGFVVELQIPVQSKIRCTE